MIFLNLLNRIFGTKKPLSRQEIDDYKKGTGDTHEIEMKSSDSDFNTEAMKGWESADYSVKEGMERADKKMEKFVNNSSKGSSQNNKGLILSFSLFVLTMLALIVFTYQGNKAFNEQTKVDIEITEQPTRIEEVDLFTEIPVEKQITSNELKKTAEVASAIPNNNVEKRDHQIRNEKNIVIQPTTEDEKIELPIQSSGKISSTSKNTLVYNVAQEVYLHSLKNVDYRAYRNRPIKVDNNLEIGIPANLATENDKQEFQPVETTDITYIDYLTKTAEHFKEGQYKIALKRYLTILDTYSDDVNANFYGGLCYFNLGQFDKSHQLFRNAYSIGYGNFREEAMWFSARANYEEKNDLKAKYFLKKIINEDGFYSQQAKELLESIGK